MVGKPLVIMDHLTFGHILPISYKEKEGKMKKRLLFLFFILLTLIFAQQTHNLEIIWVKTSPESVFNFGRCIASGDVNGDGFSDIMVVGDSVLDLSNPDSAYRGVCWVFFGGFNFDTIPDIRLNNLQKLNFWSLHSNDINGDGFDDVILGAYNNADGDGEVLIFLGGNSMDTICDYKIRGPRGQGSVFGCAVTSGDVNGDGYDDLIVGAYGAFIRPGFYPGRVFIYFGGIDFDTIPDVILNGGHENEFEAFGVSVSATGDVNGDGYNDIIIGAPDFGPSLQGRIYIYYGGNPIDTTYDVAMTGEGPLHFLGEWGVDFLRNINTYTYAHAITGCGFWSYNFSQERPGKVYVLFGKEEMDSIPDIWMIGRTPTSRLGNWTASAGDMNMNNCDEIISGAPIEYNRKGSAYIWIGEPLLDTIPDAWIRGVQYDDGIGWNVASAGDVDGDNRVEAIVSNYASNYSPTRVWVCKYTGQAIEEKGKKTIYLYHFFLEIFPNPTKSQITIRFSLAAESRVSLLIYDITGKLIKSINNNNIFKPGNHELQWDLKDKNQKRVANGVYFLQMRVNNEIREIRKIEVIK